MPMRVQSRWTPWPALETTAEALLIAITSNEVPTATGIVKPSTRTSAGTAAKPPPTPKNPVSRPTADAVMSTFSARDHTQENDGRNVMIGTSLLVIAINSASAVVSRIGHGVHLDWTLLGVFTLAAIVGSLFGGRLAARVRPERLTAAFTVLLVVVGMYTAARSFPQLV